MSRISFFLIIAIFLSIKANSQNILINEVQSSNISTIFDHTGQTPDWIEIYNSGLNTINLENYGLTDTDSLPLKWTFPSVVLNPQSYLIVYASDLDIRSADTLHTNFKLASEGEYIILSTPNGEQLDSLYFTKIPINVSLGRKTDGSNEWTFFSQPTPGTANITHGFLPITVDAVQFSNPGGSYSSGISLGLTAGLFSDSIYYTLDGSEPSKDDFLYTSPIEILNSTSVRARVFSVNYLPGSITTHTYFINRTHTLPLVAINTDPNNLWNEDSGIYAMGKNASTVMPYQGANFWKDWERPANITLFEPDGNIAFQIDAGIKIFGNWSRGFPQKSLSIHPRKTYGYGSIKYKIFPDLEIYEFSALLLRNSGNDFNNTMMRDALINRIVFDLGLDHQAYRPAVVYINGEYWGIQNIREKINTAFIASHYGIDEEEIDLLETNGTIVQGSNNLYLALLEFLANNNLSSDENYNYVKSQIDVDNYIKYQIAEIFIDNRDWPGNNIKFWRERNSGGKWKWLLFDLDFGLDPWEEKSQNFNTLEYALAPDGTRRQNAPWATFLFRKLVENPTFKNDFINCFADNLNTIFNPEVTQNTVNEMNSIIESEIINHYSRWNGCLSCRKKRLTAMKLFLQERPDMVRSHIINQFQLSGKYDLQINTEGNGQVRVNTIKVKVFPWTGSYFNEVPIEIEAIPAPGYKFVRWEGAMATSNELFPLNVSTDTNITAVFEPNNNLIDDVIINEINYKSSESFDTDDWIELYNTSEKSFNISNWSIKDKSGNHFIFSDGTVLRGNEYFVICKDIELFNNLYSDIEPYDKELGFGLSANGDCVGLYDENNTLLDEVCYEGKSPWPYEANGLGATLSLIYPTTNNQNSSNWRASSGRGTPGNKNDVITNLDTDMASEQLSYNLYPNPTNRILNIAMNSKEAKEILVRISDVSGREMLIKEGISITEGPNTITIPLDEFNKRIVPGIYIVSINYKGASTNYKLLIQN